MISKDQALDILRRHKAELKALGVRRAAVFGSVARGEAGPESDLDIMVELENPNSLTAFDYVGIKQAVAALFPVNADIVATDFLKAGVSKTADRDAVYAF